MKEITGDIWYYHSKGNWIVVTTNSTINTKGEVVMGKGLALEAKIKFPRLPKLLTNQFTTSRQRTCFWEDYRIITFPTKVNWYENSKLDIIESSCVELLDWLKDTTVTPPIYLPRVGCGNGKLQWKDVQPLLEKYLDDRFTVVYLKGVRP